MSDPIKGDETKLGDDESKLSESHLNFCLSCLRMKCYGSYFSLRKMERLEWGQIMLLFDQTINSILFEFDNRCQWLYSE